MPVQLIVIAPVGGPGNRLGLGPKKQQQMTINSAIPN
jgi:hypothetical protein